MFELALDLGSHGEGGRSATAGSGSCRPEGQRGPVQGQEGSRGDPQAEGHQAGSQRAGPGRGASRRGGELAAERGQVPEETREAAAVPRGLLQGPGA